MTDDNTSKLGKLLTQKGIITDQQFEQACEELEKLIENESKDVSLTNILIEKGYTTIHKIEQAFKDEGIFDNIPEEVRALIGKEENYIGRYVKIKEIGRGGMGQVFKAYDTSLKRFVAIKLMDSVSDDSRARFLREAETLAQLRHPNIVPVYEIGVHNGKFFIAMQFIDGTTLDLLIGRLAVRDYMKIAENISGAIEYAHSNNIVHRDLKPQNILIDKNGATYVTDFGIAKKIESTMTQTGDILGTPHYMSPEQAQGNKIDTSTDIYSLGATLYHCVTGQKPFESDSGLHLINKIVENDPESPTKINPKIHKDVSLIIMKCLQKDPLRRYKTISELKDDLNRYNNGEPVLARPVSPIYMLSKKIRKNRAILAIVSVIILISVIGTIFLTDIVNSLYGNIALHHLELGNNHYEFINNARSPEARREIPDRVEKALLEFSKAIELDKKLGEAYLKRGNLHIWVNDFTSALTDFTNCTNYSPNISESYYMLILTKWVSQYLDFYYKRVPTSIDEINLLKSYIKKLK
ncbi:MAG: protein kinase, partial [Planctomycetes bacterium]|nr:protein kinase [Planctomycetota bacterium]